VGIFGALSLHCSGTVHSLTSHTQFPGTRGGYVIKSAGQSPKWFGSCACPVLLVPTCCICRHRGRPLKPVKCKCAGRWGGQVINSASQSPYWFGSSPCPVVQLPAGCIGSTPGRPTPRGLSGTATRGCGHWCPDEVFPAGCPQP
jgi:hypothetical protein